MINTAIRFVTLAMFLASLVAAPPVISALALSRVAAFCLVRHPECDQLTTFVFEPSPIFLVHKFQECKSLMGIVLNFGSSPANMPTPSSS